MKRFLLDTGIASDYINRRHGVFERARQEVALGNRIGIGIPVLAELLFGIDMMVAAIAQTLGRCTVVSGDSDLAEVPGLSVENWAT